MKTRKVKLHTKYHRQLLVVNTGNLYKFANLIPIGCRTYKDCFTKRDFIKLFKSVYKIKLSISSMLDIF